MAGQRFGLGEFGILATCLALAVLIGVGGWPGLVGALLAAGLAALVAVLVILRGTDTVGDSLGVWLPVASATFTVVSGLAARDMWKVRGSFHSNGHAG